MANRDKIRGEWYEWAQLQLGASAEHADRAAAAAISVLDDGGSQAEAEGAARGVITADAAAPPAPAAPPSQPPSGGPMAPPPALAPPPHASPPYAPPPYAPPPYTPPGSAYQAPIAAPPSPVAPVTSGGNLRWDRSAYYSLTIGIVAVLLAFVVNRLLIVLPFVGVYYGFRGLGSTKKWAAVLGLILNVIAVFLLLSTYRR